MKVIDKMWIKKIEKDEQSRVNVAPENKGYKLYSHKAKRESLTRMDVT